MTLNWKKELLYSNNNADIGYHQALLNTKTLFKGTSLFQEVEIFTNPKFGNVLMLDGVMQTTSADEFFYHEMLTHVPLFSVNNVKKVLIIGGGDGGILREVLRHNIDVCYMIEIDEMVINACKQHMPEINNGAFNHPKAVVMAKDGIKFVKETTEVFDVIIVDSTDPNPASAVLFTQEFYQHTKRILSKNGVLVTQSGVPFFQPQELIGVNKLLASVYNSVNFYVVPVPTYVGGFMTLSFCCNNYNNINTTKQQLLNNSLVSTLSFKYYNADVHVASFSLPNYIKTLL